MWPKVTKTMDQRSWTLWTMYIYSKKLVFGGGRSNLRQAPMWRYPMREKGPNTLVEPFAPALENPKWTRESWWTRKDLGWTHAGEFLYNTGINTVGPEGPKLTVSCWLINHCCNRMPISWGKNEETSWSQTWTESQHLWKNSPSQKIKTYTVSFPKYPVPD